MKKPETITASEAPPSLNRGKSFYFSGLASGLKAFIQFAVSVYVARVLTPAEIGSYTVSLAAAAMVRAFESAGVNNFVATYQGLNRQMNQTVFTVNMILNLVLAVLLWGLAAPLGRFYGSDVMEDILRLVALSTLLNIHWEIVVGWLRRESKFKELMNIEIGLAILVGVVTVAGVYMGYGAYSLAYALVAEKVAALIVGVTMFRGYVSVGWRLKDAGVVLGYGFKLSLASVIGIFGTHSANFVLGRTLGLAPAAQFDRAFTMPGLIWRVTLPSFNNVLVPELAREKERFQAVISETVGMFALLLWPMGTALALVSSEVLILVFGPQWQFAADIAPYLLFYSLLYSPVTLACSALVAKAQGGVLIKLQVVENVTKLLLLLSAGYLGLYWLGVLMIVPIAAYVAVSLHYLHRLQLIDLRGFLCAFYSPLKVTVCCVAPVIVARLMVVEEHFSFLQLAVLALISGVFYLAGLWVWERDFLLKVLRTVGFPLPAEKA